MSADMVREIASLRISEAEAWFSVLVHRSEATGTVTPTITVIAPGLSAEHSDAMRGHLSAIANTLRDAYAPKDGAK